MILYGGSKPPPRLGNADRVCSANRSIPHWRRLIVTSVSARAKFTMPRLGDANRVCFANRSIPHWRRLAKCPDFVHAQTSPRPRHPLSSGRAGNACTNLLGFFVRYVRTRGSMRLREAQNHRLLLCHVPHALATHYFLRLTRARGE